MLTVYKPQGLTPLQTIELLKKNYPEYANETISYAGRLDPMAEGLLLLLLGEENKERRTYEGFEKSYEFEVLFGVSTDTYDLLGLITKVSPQSKLPTTSQIESLLPSFLGNHNQPYPPYSSKPVDGKPLYAWAREGKLSEITIPSKEITITSLSPLNSKTVSPAELSNNIMKRIGNVTGDFRQDAIKTSWQSYFEETPLPLYLLMSFRTTCTSGTYVRSIANSLGEKLGCGALAYSITRTQIGNILLKDAIKLEPIA